MKDVLAYTAGAVLVAYVGYIFIATDEGTRVNRACIPAAAATRLLGSVVRTVDESTGESLAKGKPQQVLSACRNAVWYWAMDNRNTPKFPESDALFGSYAEKTYAPSPKPVETTPVSKETAAPTIAEKVVVPAVKPAQPDEDRL